MQVNASLARTGKAASGPAGVSPEGLFSRKPLLLTLEHKCVKHIHLKLIEVKSITLQWAVCPPMPFIKLQPSQAAVWRCLSIFICQSLFTGRRSKTVKHTEGKTSNNLYTVRDTGTPLTKAFLVSVEPNPARFPSRLQQILKRKMRALLSLWNHTLGLFPQNKWAIWNQPQTRLRSNRAGTPDLCGPASTAHV